MATITMASPLNTHPCTSVYREIQSTQLPGIKRKKRQEVSPQCVDMTSTLKNWNCPQTSHPSVPPRAPSRQSYEGGHSPWLPFAYRTGCRPQSDLGAVCSLPLRGCRCLAAQVNSVTQDSLHRGVPFCDGLVILRVTHRYLRQLFPSLRTSISPAKSSPATIVDSCFLRYEDKIPGFIISQSVYLKLDDIALNITHVK